MSETIAFRVPSEKKREWKDAAKSSEEYNSLTHLIRLSVERELSDASRGAQTGTQSATSTQEMGKMLNKMDTLDARIRTAQEDISRILKRSHAIGGIPDNETVEEVFATLEVGDVGDRLRTDDIVEKVDADTPEAEMALERLNEEMNSVEKESLPDGDYWFRRSEP